MYEHKTTRPLPRPAFARRMISHIAAAVGLLAISLGIGIVGYHGYGEQDWLDAFVSASMILTGMGPTGEPHTTAGKVFAAVYALYSGAVFLVLFGLVAAPVLHRMLHSFHFDEKV